MQGYAVAYTDHVQTSLQIIEIKYVVAYVVWHYWCQCGLHEKKKKIVKFWSEKINKRVTSIDQQTDGI